MVLHGGQYTERYTQRELSAELSPIPLDFQDVCGHRKRRAHPLGLGKY
jgi:hypothetical protein